MESNTIAASPSKFVKTLRQICLSFAEPRGTNLFAPSVPYQLLLSPEDVYGLTEILKAMRHSSTSEPPLKTDTKTGAKSSCGNCEVVCKILSRARSIQTSVNVLLRQVGRRPWAYADRTAQPSDRIFRGARRG